MAPSASTHTSQSREHLHPNPPSSPFPSSNCLPYTLESTTTVETTTRHACKIKSLLLTPINKV
ncbi:hypothetical protein HYFRA_00000280 [Hymenoscyphus fraxineus]|uniref:Uncharacterized protein n=1 Tax=Hymenoscyphus fraxineus TaxID=746836 RepID=A0A9N9PWM0_9HELO|nr:hypothetical protein HYFRA_00000280 [Hymenoscyphus fraxineus]